MNNSEFSQTIEKLGKSGNILIVTSPGASGDDLAAALALKNFLSKLEKEAHVLCPGAINDKFSFLPGFLEIKPGLNVTKSFVIDVSTRKTEIEELSYKKETDKLAIFIKPKKGQFNHEDISFRTSSFPFDVIICVGVSSPDSLEDFYAENTELFFETPIINIDRSPANDNYGQINLIMLSATSNSEIVYDLINVFESSLLDHDIATALLTGIIIETNSFQHIRTTPAAFLKASQLVSLGANQQEIVGKLYKNKSLGFLKLWGRVLARIKQEPQHQMVYSMINVSDIQKSEASEEDTALIIKEMAAQLSFAKTFFLLIEAQGKVECFGLSHSAISLPQIFSSLHPKTVGRAVRFEIAGSLLEAERQILSRLTEAAQ
jgi:nanoRNase/pAp phosphatase (c-di-AMP/oligoRNAs hydrolase)